ncbi:MAG: hypothetical protein OEW58_12295 [Gammaproteobacteria bacterium]|nr:hypothetical protein [Gammaproteobacteria bacterium]
MSRLSDAANAMGDSVEQGINAVAEVVSDIFETLGNVVEDKADSWFARVSVVGPVLNWLAGLVSDSCDVIAAVVKGALGIVGGAISGVIKNIGGIVGIDRALILRGWIDVVSSIAGAFIIIGGKLLALLQSATLFENRERKLTDDEIKLLRRVFHSSLAYYSIRLVQGKAGLFGLNPRPFALGNTIYLKNRDVSHEPALLVHECTHVWQYQHCGARYASDAIGAQWFIEDAYNWEKEVLRGKEHWTQFNREAQAQFLEQLFIKGQRFTGQKLLASGKGAFYDADGVASTGRFIVAGVDHTARAIDALAEIRDEASQRLSAHVASSATNSVMPS